jgi:cellulose synthase/poly-beta-1,6-N-acetylglucosamine synthase-like glycosyltransferase
VQLDVLKDILVLAVMAGTVVYGGFLLALCLGLMRPRRPSRTPDPLPRVSVVIPMHDEEALVAATLIALDAQDYPGSWELVCVDDRSTDRTPEILQGFISRMPRMRVVRIDPSEPPVPSPKKRALSRGLESATGEILVTTDADCIPPPHWISTLVSFFQPGVDVVQGPKHCLGDGRSCHRYQRLETMAFVSAEAAGFSLGKPFLASAPSLAYRKSAYEKAGGFRGLEGLISGDDDMLVHRMVRAGAGVSYAMDASVSVATRPADTWNQVLNQRARWASNGSRYESIPYVALLVFVFLWWCWLLAGWIPWVFELVPGWSWWGVWAFKLPLDLAFLGLAAWRFRKWGALLDYPWCLPVQVLVAVRSAIAGHLGWFRWTREADGG